MSSLEPFINNLGFPCVGAKTALSKGQITTYEAGNLRCPSNDANILAAVHAFVALYDLEQNLYSSLIVTFGGPPRLSEEDFEQHLWARLNALHALDARQFQWDETVSRDPNAPNFSLSLGGRAFYVVGMHPHSGRKARRFQSPAIVFNLHAQFEQLRSSGAYESMKKVIRRRDTVYSGSVNPMLADFGSRSEARQYSGRQVEGAWKCPFSPAPQPSSQVRQ